MQEKRKNVRLPIKLKLEVSNLFKQDGVKIENLDAEIEVFDISKAGIGFMSLSKLPVNYYFNATIEFEFVGLPSMYDYIFEEYAQNL